MRGSPVPLAPSRSHANPCPLPRAIPSSHPRPLLLPARSGVVTNARRRGEMERGEGEVEKAARHSARLTWRSRVHLPRSVLSSRQIIADGGGWPWWISLMVFWICDTRARVMRSKAKECGLPFAYPRDRSILNYRAAKSLIAKADPFSLARRRPVQ